VPEQVQGARRSGAARAPRAQPKPSESLGIPDPYTDCVPFDAKSRYLPEL